MALQSINIGTVPNDGTGERLKDAFNKVNLNFNELYASWLNLVSGYTNIEDLTPIATGEVIKYTYIGGAIRYRFIATDESEDSFYLNYSAGVFTNLVATKKITL
jgi:hypothetical protein